MAFLQVLVFRTTSSLFIKDNPKKEVCRKQCCARTDKTEIFLRVRLQKEAALVGSIGPSILIIVRMSLLWQWVERMNHLYYVSATEFDAWNHRCS